MRHLLGPLATTIGCGLILGACAAGPPPSAVDRALLLCVTQIEADSPSACAEALEPHYATASVEDRDRIDQLLAAAASGQDDSKATLFYLKRRLQNGHAAARRTPDLERLAQAAALANDTPTCVGTLALLPESTAALGPAKAWRRATLHRACPDLPGALTFMELAIERAPKPVPAWLKQRSAVTRLLGRYHENAVLELDLALRFPSDALGDADFSQIWADEIGKSPNDSEVVGALTRRCAAQALAACEVLALLRLAGAESDRDEEAGERLLAETCGAGSMRACQWLATRRSKREESPGERAHTLALFDRACAAGNATACTERGNAYETGVGGAVDLEAAHRLYREACSDGFVGACNALFALQDAGGILSAEVRRDVETGCKARYRSSCTLLANHAVTRENPWPEIEAFGAAACALGELDYCGFLGISYELGKSTPRSPGRALEYYQHACMAGHARSCTRVGPVEALVYAEGGLQAPALGN